MTRTKIVELFAPVRRLLLHGTVVNSLEEARIERPKDDHVAASKSTGRGDEGMLWTNPDSTHAGLAAAVGHVEATDQIVEAFMPFMDDRSRRRGGFAIVRA